MVASTPPKNRGPLSTGEMRLAYSMVLPTLVIVLAIVLFPLLANFWISFKPVQLGDLRPPEVRANERIKPLPEKVGDVAQISYRIRNSSQSGNVENIVFTDNLPAGLVIDNSGLDPRCELVGSELSCLLGTFDPGQRETLVIDVQADQAFIDSPVNPRDSKPIINGDSDNILTNSKLSLQNYRKVFSAPEFWTVLRVSLYYTLFALWCLVYSQHNYSVRRFQVGEYCVGSFFFRTLLRLSP